MNTPMEQMSDKLLKFLKDKKNIFIQTHDFPDPDAIAAAFGLQYFLKENKIASNIIYDGELQTNPVDSMIEYLGIPLQHIDETTLREEDNIIIIDGSKGNKNVTHQIGTVIAVIDHHLGEDPEDVPFVDVRADYGSSATIISQYLQEQNIKLTDKIATALAIGIHVDTSSFKRRTSCNDIDALAFLNPKIDYKLLGSILRKNLLKQDLVVLEKALQVVKIADKLAFCYYPDECPQNFLGILADFFMAIEEVQFVVICAKRGSKIILSTRSENENWNTASIIKVVLKGIGAGGGHKDMAGGEIRDATLFDEAQIYQQFRDQLGI